MEGLLLITTPIMQQLRVHNSLDPQISEMFHKYVGHGWPLILVQNLCLHGEGKRMASHGADHNGFISWVGDLLVLRFY